MLANGEKISRNASGRSGFIRGGANLPGLAAMVKNVYGCRKLPSFKSGRAADNLDDPSLRSRQIDKLGHG